MSLTKQDLTDIRAVVVDAIVEALDSLVLPRLDALETKVDALEKQINFLGQRVTSLETASHETNRRLAAVETRLEGVEARLEALENDVKEIYGMLPSQSLIRHDKQYAKLSNEQKAQWLQKEVNVLAQQLPKAN